MKIYRTVDGKLIRGVEVSQSKKFVKSSFEERLEDLLNDVMDLPPDKQEKLFRELNVDSFDEFVDSFYSTAYPDVNLEQAEYIIRNISELTSGCHGKSDKHRREKKEDELESSRNARTFSKFNRISSLFIKNDVLKPGKTGIELNINGWKIINKEGKPTGGEAAEFNSEKAAKASEIYRRLVDRYGAENVRTFKQD